MVTCHSQGHPTCPGTQFFWSRLRAASSIVGFISTIGLLTPATARKLPHLTAEKFSIKIIIGNFVLWVESARNTFVMRVFAIVGVRVDLSQEGIASVIHPFCAVYAMGTRARVLF